MSDTNKDQTAATDEAKAQAAAGGALSGVQQPTRLNIGGDDVERLKADLQRHKVEEGRVKSLAEQLKAQKEELEALRQKLADAEKTRGKPLSDFVDPARRKVVDDDILMANEDMIRGSQKDLLDEVDKRVTPLQRTLEEERAARIRAESASFDSQIEQLHQGFAAETNPGGKFVDQWTAYLAKVDRRTGLTNGEILSKAYHERRIDGVDGMIADFKTSAGISRQEGARGGAFPGKQTPYVAQGGAPRESRRYTISEYKKELAESGDAYSRGLITATERRKVIDKFKQAMSEGRIVNDPAPQVGV
jgi:hypothetical protein